MKKPKLDFYRAGIALKIQKARELVTHMTNNSNFSSPNPTLQTVTTAINALETAYEAALDGGKTLKSIMRRKLIILNDLISQLKDYISNVSAGDELKILSSGLQVKELKGRGKRKPSVKQGENPGEVICTGEAPKRGVRAGHEFQLCKDPIPADAHDALANPWVEADISSQPKVTITNLTGGAKLWFRHRFILPKGKKSAWVIIGSVIVPK